MATFAEGATDVQSEQAEREAAERLRSAPELAVDVEADAMHAFRARLCFVQIGTDEDVFLFDTLAAGVRADLLADQFADPLRTKFFHAAGGDLQFLAEAGVRVRGLFDTHRAATLLGWPKVGLADLARELVGRELPKEHQQADFSIRPTPPELREYIANDVRYLCEIGRQVRAACIQADVLEEVVLDCDRLADEAQARPDLEAFKPKLPRGGINPKQLAVALALATELHRMRLKWAEAANIPMGRMLSNAAITAVATKPPSTIKELARVQGVRGQVVREHGEEILALIRDTIQKSRDGALPPPADDRGPRDPSRKKREESLKVWRARKAEDRKVTPSVVLPNPLIEDLSRAPPESIDALAALPYVGAKRVTLYGAELVELLRKA